MKQEINLLDTTLRDGSYSINFQFTASDTSLIASGLEQAGLKFIEIGHGIGLRASESGRGTAAELDEDYLRAAAESVRKARWGMFCIPGIARVEDVDMAAGFGMKFIRVGTNVSDVHQAKEFIEVAKKHDMFVGANFMKSYTMKPAEFAERARLAQQYGADVLYIVDSAGGMLQSDVDDYFHAVQDRCDIPLGFHGHNNLGLAVSHSLRAIELGATMVDCTLQGLGRSAGNAPTELMVMALSRMGMDLGIDPIKILDLGERCIRPLIKSRGLRSLDVVAGFAQFHSSYMGTIRRFSSKYRIDPRRLIIEVCRVNKVDAPADLVEETARRLSGAQDGVLTARFDFDEYFGDEQVGGKT